MALPSGYKQVEYIESSGTQYIDTGFKPNYNTRVVTDFELFDTITLPTVFGAWNSAINSAFIFLAYSGLAEVANFYGSVQKDITLNCTGRHTIDANKRVFSLDGTVIHTFSSATFTTSYNLLLFAYNSAGKASNLTGGRIYSCQIYDNGTIVRNFVPCINPSGTVGLYDDVNSKFYTNAGSGVFVAGAVIDTFALSSRENVGGVLKAHIDAYENVGGVLKKIVRGYQNVGGVLVSLDD